MEVDIIFLQDLTTWEGTYEKGSVHACPERLAREWASEGIVSIKEADEAASESPAPALEVSPANKLTARKGKTK